MLREYTEPQHSKVNCQRPLQVAKMYIGHLAALKLMVLLSEDYASAKTTILLGWRRGRGYLPASQLRYTRKHSSFSSISR